MQTSVRALPAFPEEFQGLPAPSAPPGLDKLSKQGSFDAWPFQLVTLLPSFIAIATQIVSGWATTALFAGLST